MPPSKRCKCCWGCIGESGAQLLLLRSAHNSLSRCARCVPGTWPDSNRCWLSIRTVDGNTAVGGLGWGQFIHVHAVCALAGACRAERRVTPGREETRSLRQSQRPVAYLVVYFA